MYKCMATRSAAYHAACILAEINTERTKDIEQETGHLQKLLLNSPQP